MKKSLKKLELKKQTISDLNLGKVKGGIDTRLLSDPEICLTCVDLPNGGHAYCY
ncbi:hypothetical protein ACWGOQ_0000540 [Aquimarina sp. M1]